MYEEMKRILFDIDEKNSRLITLKNEAGEEVKFLQVYAMVWGNEIYCILSPAVVVKNTKNKSGFVFKLLSTGELKFEDNAEISSEIFRNYYADLSGKRDKT